MVIHNGSPAVETLHKFVSVLTRGYEAVKAQAGQYKKEIADKAAPVCSKLTRQGIDFLEEMGMAAWADLQNIGQSIGSRLHPVYERMMEKAEGVTNRCGNKITDFFLGMARPFRHLYRAPRLIAGAYTEGGVGQAARTLVQGVRNNLYVCKTVVNYALPVIGIFMLHQVVEAGTQVTYALAVEQDGQVIAYVQDESVYTEAQRDLLSRIINTDDEAELNLDPVFAVAAVNPEEIADSEKLTDQLIQLSTADIQEAQGLYIDGEFYGAVKTASLIKDVLDDTLAQYTTGAEDETVKFVQDIQLREGLYPTASVVEDEEITELLTSEVQSRKTYTIEQGDSPIMIANKNGLTYSEFKTMNPDIEEECMVGQEAVISESQPFLSVEVTKTITYDEAIPYETETTKDNTKAKGYSEVTQEGEEGSKTITASVTLINGVEEEREILSETVTKEPVTKMVTEGTKVETVSYARYVPNSYGSGSVSGDFLWPAGSGYISCYYGQGGHGGLDIASSYGTPIYASMSGTVVVSGWYYNYGKCIVIDHGNGVRTLYGHCSSLYVSVGEYVSQGQNIAAMGSTGYSTGNHLHFEVIVNGGRRNPLNYL